MNTSHTPARSLARQPAYYEHAQSYDRDTGVFQPYRRAVVEALPLQPGQVVLDVGCGTGLCCGLLRDKVGPGGTVIGIEESPEMAAIAREHIARAGWRNVTVVRSAAGRQRKLAAAIPGASVHEVSADHAVCITAPQVFAQALLQACWSVTLGSAAGVVTTAG
jgi:precorrin-6B methylase 2